eukprot:9177312-Pyramimonas_sp.AAC.1
MLGALTPVRSDQAQGTFALFMQQAKSVGTPAIEDLRNSEEPIPILDERSDEAMPPPPEGPAEDAVAVGGDAVMIVDEEGPAAAPSRLDKEESPPHVVHVYAICTDAGPDEAGSRRILHGLCARVPRVWLFDIDCLAHQCHLMVSTSLKLFNDFTTEHFGWKYGAVLSKLMHCWREKGVDIHDEWKRQYGEGRAFEFEFAKLGPGARSAPEQPIRGPLPPPSTSGQGVPWSGAAVSLLRYWVGFLFRAAAIGFRPSVYTGGGGKSRSARSLSLKPNWMRSDRFFGLCC